MDYILDHYHIDHFLTSFTRHTMALALLPYVRLPFVLLSIRDAHGGLPKGAQEDV